MYLRNGMAKRDTVKLEQAAGYLEQVLQKRPDDLQAMKDLAAIYGETGHADQAIKYFDQALSKNPKDPELRMYYGRTLHVLGQPDKAMEQFKAVEQLSPDNVEAVRQLALFFVQAEDWNHAEPYMERLVTLQPEQANFWNVLGQVYARVGKSDKALEAIKKAEELQGKKSQ